MRTLKHYIFTDLKQIVGGGTTIIDCLKWYFIPKGECFPFMVWFRIVWMLKHSKSKYKKVLLAPAYLIFRHFEFKYGIHINTNIDVGEGLHVVHGDGVYLNAQSIGNNVKVYQGVTVGEGANGGIPTIKDNVTLYTNSVIVGAIELNAFSVVGANAFVNKTVNTCEIVAGIPAKVIGTSIASD